MTPKKIFIVSICVLFTLIFCPFFIKASDFDYTFNPKISLSGFNISSPNTRSQNYGQASLSVPLFLYYKQFSLGAEYFFAYDYFDKQKDSYDKLNRANLSYNKGGFLAMAGRDFLDFGLNSVIYFGYYEDKDLLKPTYFDGALVKYTLLPLCEMAAVAGTYQDADFYGAILQVLYLKGFAFKTKEDGSKLEVYGANINYSSDNFAIDLLMAFNRGKKQMKFIIPLPDQKYEGKLYSGEISFKKETSLFNTKTSLGAQYLSPTKDNSLGYRGINANLDRGFIFGNLTDGFETLSYKFDLQINPNFLKDLTMQAKLYSFAATDKRLADRELANEIDAVVAYQYKGAKIRFVYGYLTTLDGFNAFMTGLEEVKHLHKFGLSLSYQF